MKESLWGYYLVLLGITVSTIMIMVSNMTTTNQQNYYLLKEVTNAAMIDAIDYGYYREYGTVKINTEKFVENFLRRFSEGISKTNTYKIDFYSVYENPPSVSIRITSNTGEYNIAGDNTNIDVVNSIDAILEANNVITYSKVLYSLPYSHCKESNYISSNTNSSDYGHCRLINRAELNVEKMLSEEELEYIGEQLEKQGKIFDSSKLKISNVEYLNHMTTKDDIDAYNNMYESTYKREESLSDVNKNNNIDDSLSLAKNIKNVKITIKKENNRFYLGYGLDFNCDGVKTINENRGQDYRIGTTTSNMKYVSESVYNSTYKNMYYLKPSESITGTSWFGSGISESEYEKLTATEKTMYIKFEKVPWYGNCLVGIKYRVNFYYDAS